jgi:hypothetical protein
MAQAMAIRSFAGRLRSGALIGALAAGCALLLSVTMPAAAQNFFERLFPPFPGGGIFSPGPPPEAQRPVDSSRAPAPRKPDTPPTTTVMIFGDSLADWLAYGFEDAMTDTPEIGVIRKARVGSGLIRYDQRNESQEWAQPIREALAAEKPDFVVMMIGLNDRQAFRVRAGQAKAEKPQSEKPEAQDQEQENPEQPNIIAPEQQRKNAPGIYEFQSERWEELYTRRIDETIAALKSRGVPVFWVGLPALRGQKAQADASYLNDLFRARAEKAGVVYVDIWDGFVDEQGRYAVQGPDYEGQNRRLRTSDGIHFTKAGARKLAHYLEREINRVGPIQPATVALPEPQQQTPSDRAGGATARPLAGPAVPLAPFARAGEELIGMGPIRSDKSDWASQAANAVLIKGDTLPAPAGRADDFAWPRRGIAPFGTDTVVTTTTMPVPLAQLPPPPPKVEPVARTASSARTAAVPLGPGPGGLQQQEPRLQARPSFNPFSFFGLFR